MLYSDRTDNEDLSFDNHIHNVLYYSISLTPRCITYTTLLNKKKNNDLKEFQDYKNRELCHCSNISINTQNKKFNKLCKRTVVVK